MASRLKVKYDQEIIKALMEKFSYSNVMEVPKLEKVIINMGILTPTLKLKRVKNDDKVDP